MSGHWYSVAGQPFHSPVPRTDLGPEIPAPGSDPGTKPEAKPERSTEAQKKETKQK